MARSVAELLPVAFEDLSLDHVAEIIERVGDEEETLWFEKKASVTPASLAKATSAFANTYGGLLVVGVADDDAALVGIEPLAAEAQLWVKDVLRAHVLPMPPFRARWLPTRDDKGILLVLVEESSTTPHLLIRTGAIYVRNPGSSDPVPIDDQRRLLSLTSRGEEAQRHAINLTNELHDAYLHGGDTRRLETLTAAATGVSAVFGQRLFRPGVVDQIGETVWGDLVPHNREWRRPHWQQHRLGVERFLHRDWNFNEGDVIGGAVIDRRGAVAVYAGHTLPQNADHRGYEAVTQSQLRESFNSALAAARNVLLDLGAHGDLRVSYRLTLAGRNILFDEIPNHPWGRDVNDPIGVARWADFEEDIAPDVFAEVARAVGIPPAA